MKRVIAIAMLALLIMSACGCENRATAETNSSNRMQILADSLTYVVYVDTLTGVQYLRVYNGGVCVMVDADGNPLIKGNNSK